MRALSPDGAGGIISEADALDDGGDATLCGRGGPEIPTTASRHGTGRRARLFSEDDALAAGGLAGRDGPAVLGLEKKVWYCRYQSDARSVSAGSETGRAF